MAKVTGTKEAFYQLLETRGIYNILKVDRSTVSNWKRALRGEDDKYIPTIDKMEEMLTRAGAAVVRDKVWELP